MKTPILLRAVPLLLVSVPLLFLFLQPGVQSATTTDVSDLQQRMNDNLARSRLLQAAYQAEALASQTGWSVELARAAGQVWEQMGDLSRAVAYWEIALQLQPEDISVLRYLAQQYVALQRWPEANETLKRLLTYAPDDKRARYDLGLLAAAFDPANAGEHLQIAARDLLYRDISLELLQALNADRVDGTTMTHVGLVFAGHELWPYAELAFLRTTEATDIFPEALAYLGLARDKQGKDGSAAIERAVMLAPDNSQVLFLHGLHLRSVYDYTASLSAFLKASAADPDSPAYAAEVSTAYRLVGNLGAAEAWLKTAVTLSDNDPRFADLLSTFYADLEATERLP